MKVCVAMALLGLSVLVPSIWDGILGVTNSLLRTNVDLEVPKWIGWILLIAGMVGGIGLYLGACRTAGASVTATPDQVLAISHSSFPTNAPRLTASDLGLPGHFVSERSCDLSASFTGRVDPEGALAQQELLIQDVRSLMRVAAYKVAYGGLAHIPLQFQLGHALATGAPWRLFEKNRHQNVWCELVPSGEQLEVSTDWRVDESASCGVIKVCVSYEIDDSSVAEVVREPAVSATLRLDPPRLDAVTAYSQVEELSRAFRSVLDGLRSRLPSHATVHVFYAGPSSVGVSLGRQISSSIHNRTLVYNYSREATPHYAWAIHVNSQRPRVVRAGSEDTHV